LTSGSSPTDVASQSPSNQDPGQGARRQTAGILLEAVIDAFMASYRGRDPSLHARLAFWKERIGHLPVASIDSECVEDQMSLLAARGALKYVRGQGVVPAGRPLSPATLNRHLVALGSVLRFARKARLLPRNHPHAIQGVDKEREGDGRLLYLSEDEVERVIAAAGVARWRKLPVLIRMAFTTGLRLGALQGLRWRDIDLEAGRAVVVRAKNGRPHVAHLTPQTIKALRSLPGHRLPDGLVFSGADERKPHTFRKAWQNACSAAGVGHVPFHALRHSCASHLAAKGASSVLLADTLGHRSLRMVTRYAHLSIDARASAIERAFA
jgi:integrase